MAAKVSVDLSAFCKAAEHDHVQSSGTPFQAAASNMIPSNPAATVLGPVNGSVGPVLSRVNKI